MSFITFYLPFLGFIQPAQILILLAGATEESGAQQSIETMFTSSASKTDFGACKDLSLLQQVIAKDHGSEETAHYLEDVTERYLCDNGENKTKITVQIGAQAV